MFGINKVHDLLMIIQSANEGRFHRESIKHSVYSRLSELQSQGYVDDVALVISMREHGIIN